MSGSTFLFIIILWAVGSFLLLLSLGQAVNMLIQVVNKLKDNSACEWSLYPQIIQATVGSFLLLISIMALILEIA